MSQDDHQLAVELASAAGELLLCLRKAGLFAAKALGDQGDRVSNAFLVGALKALRPADAILSEEEKDNAARLAAERVWVIDPLDGTREYGEGRRDWAVHVALCVGGVPAAAAVALPEQGLTLGTAAPQAAEPPAGQLRILVSRSRAPRIAERVAARLGAQLVPMGSAGAKAMAVLRGEAQAYVHAGGQYEWDSCAPTGVALAAGLHVSRLDGSPLQFNRADPWLPDLLVCRPEHAEVLLQALALERQADD